MDVGLVVVRNKVSRDYFWSMVPKMVRLEQLEIRAGVEVRNGMEWKIAQRR